MQWFYGVAGRQEGPVPLEKLEELIAAGAVRPQDLVWREGMEEWLPVAQVPELAPPPAPPPVRSPTATGPSAPPARPQQAALPAPGSGARPAAAATRPVRKRPWPMTVLALLWTLSGLLLLVAGLAAFVFVPNEPDTLPVRIGGAVLAAFGFLLTLAGVGVWGLKVYGRVLAFVFAVPMLIQIPIGTVVGILIIAYFASKGVGLLFSGRPVESFTAEEAVELARAQRSGIGTALGVILIIQIAMIFLILPAIAVPNLLEAIQRGKQKRSMTDMRVLAQAIENYAVDENAYPEHVGPVSGLEGYLVPTYINRINATDGWENAFIYELHEDQRGYTLVSHGKDGAPSGPAEGALSSYEDDIVLETGSFVTWPEASNGGDPGS